MLCNILGFACLINGEELLFTDGLGLSSNVVSAAWVCVKWQDECDWGITWPNLKQCPSSCLE
jgi:hypothetical protein